MSNLINDKVLVARIDTTNINVLTNRDLDNLGMTPFDVHTRLINGTGWVLYKYHHPYVRTIIPPGNAYNRWLAEYDELLAVSTGWGNVDDVLSQAVRFGIPIPPDVMGEIAHEYYTFEFKPAPVTGGKRKTRRVKKIKRKSRKNRRKTNRRRR